MTDYFNPDMKLNDVNSMSCLGLAHIGDCVYELCVREYLCLNGHKAVSKLHSLTVGYVNANYQAEAMERLLPLLSPEETAVYKRGRNTKVHSVPHNSSLMQYHNATGLECLFGWLFLQGMTGRINELFAAAIGE